MSASEHSHSEEDASSSLGVAFFLNLAFTILEVAGGIWTGSIAILSDALHDAGDCLSLGLAWYLQKLSRRGPDARFTYGYRRFSNLGALITGVVLMAGLCIIGWHAVQRLQQPREVNSEGMMAIAVAGIIFNGIAAWKLHGGHSLNQKMASWHLLEDVLGWIAVLIGSGIMTVWHLPIIDPLLSLGISIFILWNVFGNVRKSPWSFYRAPRLDST